MKNIVIFASGSGSNAQRIIEYFKGKNTAAVSVIYCNRPDARVLERAKKLNIPTVVFDKTGFYETGHVLQQLKHICPDLIVLAGFLWKVPREIIHTFPQKIVNIHPALLPKYGGIGMYGKHVHDAVIQNREKESGITIHYVNENYDEGDIIMQAKCNVEPADSPETLAQKIHELEYRYFPEIIEQILTDS